MELYGHLSSKSVFSKDDEDDEFYPYVSLEINLDFKSRAGL